MVKTASLSDSSGNIAGSDAEGRLHIVPTMRSIRRSSRTSPSSHAASFPTRSASNRYTGSDRFFRIPKRPSNPHAGHLLQRGDVWDLETCAHTQPRRSQSLNGRRPSIEPDCCDSLPQA